MRSKGDFSRRVLAARIGPTPGSTWKYVHIISRTPFSFLVSKAEENQKGVTSNE
jgi:hypothetical protein